MGVTVHHAGEEPVATPAPVLEAAPAPARTPSETLIAAAVTTGTFTGPSGRRYDVKRITPLDRMIVARTIGGELMSNAVYASYAMVACSITAIDGQKVGMPASVARVEFMVQRIGTDWDALNLYMALLFNPPAIEVDQDDGAL